MTQEAWGQFFAEHAFQLVLLPVLVVLSAFFSAAETALFNLSRLQLYRFSHAGPGGRLLAHLMKRPRRVLNTVLLGNMLVNTAYSAIAAILLLRLENEGLSGWTVAVISPAPLVVLVLFGEVGAKSLALALKERLALAAAPIMAMLGRAVAPLLWIVERALVWPLSRMIAPRQTGEADITIDELGALMDLSAKRGVIDLEANALLQEIVSLTEIRVRDVMVPRVDIIACGVEASGEEVGELFRKTRLRRIPVYEGDLDHALGVVHAKRFLLHRDRPIRELVTTIPFVPDTANLERLLLQLRVKRTQVAIVIDEYGGTAGLVTLEDVLEEIVGDIPDPHITPQPAVEQISPREYLVDADLAIHEWADAFRTDLVGKRISTVGGFVLSLLGRIPRPGDAVTYRNLRFTVQSMRRRRIDRLQLELLGQEDES